MALPTVPTLTSIVTEALRKASYTNIPTLVQTRAETEWIDEIKSAIMNDVNKNSRKLKLLFKTAYTVTTIGIHRYANPSDYSSDLNLVLLTGTNTGIAQTGTSNSITLASTEDVTSAFAVGKYVLITSGTGIYSSSQISAYNATTKVASVSPDFSVSPSSDSGYMIVDRVRDLVEKDVTKFDLLTLTTKSEPLNYYPIGSPTYGEFILYPTPDVVYGLQMRYYVDLLRVDLASTLMSTLYEKWRVMWVQGIYMKALQNIDDPNASKETKMFYDYTLPAFLDKEAHGVEWNDLQFTVNL